jgi:uncharacterized protein involved in copper resistance
MSAFFRVFSALVLLPLATTLSYGQHEMHNMPGVSKPAPPAADSTRHPAAPVDHSRMKHGSMDHDQMPDTSLPDTTHADMGMESMSHAYSRRLPMGRNGSGTAWNPNQTPMYMGMSHHGPWMVMNHGAVYLRYSNQNVGRSAGQRGGSTFDAPNWFMSMAQRNVGAD